MNWNELLTALTPLLWAIVEAFRYRRRREYKRQSERPGPLSTLPPSYRGDYDSTLPPPPRPPSDGMPGRPVERDSYPATPAESRAKRRARQRRARGR